MTKLPLIFDEYSYREYQDASQAGGNKEDDLGDHSVNAGATVAWNSEKKVVGLCSLIRLRSQCRLLFRRTRSHIRDDATDVTVLWFVISGNLSVTHQHGHCVARNGDFVITKSTSPFTVECRADEGAVHEVLRVIVPTSTFWRYIPYETGIGFAGSAERRVFRIAEHLLTDLFESADKLAPHIEQLLLENALAVLGDAMRSRENTRKARQPISDTRFQGVLRFIEIHLSDPKLNAQMVADACGISLRYLSRLLSRNGVSFPKLVWNSRLEIARQWLASTGMRETSIAEIAFRTGFKSPSHFCRAFKRAYKMSPSEFRSARLSDGVHQQLAEHRTPAVVSPTKRTH